MASRSWFRNIADILRAETGDLRELAKLAGSDPATLYIGTNLDGVDVRGQDLRGMALPGLNLNRVLRDDRTLIDAGSTGDEEDPGAPALLAPEEDFNAVVLVLGSGLSPLALRHRPRTRRLKVFESHALQAMIDAARSGLPAFIIFTRQEIDTAARAAAALRRLGVGFIGILRERGHFRWGTPETLTLSEEVSPLVVIAPHDQGFGGRGDTVASEIRDFIGLAIEDWALVSDALVPQELNIFMRAQALSPQREIDATTQILDRMATRGLEHRGVNLLVSRMREEFRVGDPRVKFAEQAFRPREVIAQVQPFGRSGRHELDFAVLTQIRPAPHNALYFDATQELVALVERDARIRSDEIVIGEARDIVVSRGERGRAPLSWEPDPAAIEAFDFETTHRLELSEHADIAFVVFRMVEHGEIWLTARDLFGFSLAPDSAWLLIASQLRRVARCGNTGARQTYLGLVLRAALKREPAERPEEDPWTVALNAEAFRTDWRVTLMDLRYTGDLFNARLRLDGRGKRLPAGDAIADLWIDASGPRLDRST